LGKIFLGFFLISVASAFFYVILFVVTLLNIIHLGDWTWLISIGSLYFFLGLTILFLLGGFLLIVIVRLRKPVENGIIKYNPMYAPSVCVALTAYNDEISIGDAVTDFRGQPVVKKVIVVDNNSVDRTSKRALEAGALVMKEEKQGYGYACMRGLREALKFTDCNIIALCEGDMTFNAYDLRKQVPYLDNADMVIGTRTTQELLAKNSQLDLFYVWGNLFLAKLIQIKFIDIKCLGRVRLTDVGCTYRIIRREALQKIINMLSVGSDHFSPHMIIVALKNNLKVVEIPITFKKRVGVSKGAGGSKKKAVKVGLSMLKHILTF
jgi:glycosyltransferase involved in cell wall biosynthesis